MRLDAIRAFGFERFFAASGLAPVDSGTEGTLYSVGPPASPTVVLHVEDATPAPDGMAKVDWLPVAPHLASASEAVTWTFGKPATGYVVPRSQSSTGADPDSR